MGHVSNEDAGHAMTDVITGNTKRIYLSHLSQDNNMKDLARKECWPSIERTRY